MTVRAKDLEGRCGGVDEEEGEEYGNAVSSA